MQDLKDALEDAVPLGNIDYECDNLVVSAVDTSFKAVGYYIYQEGQSNQKGVCEIWVNHFECE